MAWLTLLAVFALGLRHGLDPDHVASVDALTYQGGSRWAGALFALGHGGAVTLVAVLVSLLSTRGQVPAALSRVGEWAPVVLLVLVGAFNTRQLLAGEAPGGPKAWAVRWLRLGDRPAMVAAVGFVFGLAFDTASQAAAWGYAAAAGAGPVVALAVGLAFTAGMALTDAVDGQLAATLGSGSYRRALGWFTVGLSFVVAGYLAASHLDPRLELGDGLVSALGAVLVALLTLALVRARALAPGSGTPASG